HAMRMDEASVLTVEAYRFGAMLVDEPGKLLIELGKRHLDDRQGSLIGHAHAAMAAALDAHLAHQLIDAPAAAVNDDRPHSHQPQQRDVASEAGHQRRIGHRLSTEADDERLPVV